MSGITPVTLNVGVGGIQLAVDNDGTLNYQVMKLGFSATGVTPVQVSSSNPLPISASSLPLPTGAAADSSINGILLAQGSSTGSQKGPLVQGAVTTGAPTYASGQTSPLSLDTAGNLRVNIAAGGGSGGTSQTDNATFTRGTTAETPVGGVVESSVPTLTAGRTSAFSMTTSGELRTVVDNGISTWASKKTGQIKATATAIKASAGTLGSLSVDNPNGSAVYCQVFDAATGSVTLGSTAPDMQFMVPAGGGNNPNLGAPGVAFGTAITIAFTTTAGGSSAPGTSCGYTAAYT